MIKEILKTSIPQAILVLGTIILIVIIWDWLRPKDDRYYAIHHERHIEEANSQEGNRKTFLTSKSKS